MVVKIALELILQPLKVLSVRNKNSENSENPKITPSTKFIIEGIYKTYFEYKCITVHKLHKVAWKTSGMKKEIWSFIKDFSDKKLS